MEVNQLLLFFFSALGAFNGLILSLYFLFVLKPRHLSHYFLGGFLLAISLRVGKSVFFYFLDNLADVYIQLGLFACWLIGPFLIYYILSALELNLKFSYRDKLHWVLVLVIGLFFFLRYPRSQYEDLWTCWFIYIIYCQWVIYSGIAAYLLFVYRDKWLNKTKFKFWVISIYTGNVIICLTYLTAPYTSYIVGALSFSFLFYLLILLLVFSNKRQELIFMHPPKYLFKNINPDQIQAISRHLLKLMSEDQIFKNSNLKLSQLAKKLHITPNLLSQYLNDEVKMGFADFINYHRIEEAKNKISLFPELTLEAIGYESGFNSKTTFYTAFKKHVGTTPAGYKRNLHNI